MSKPLSEKRAGDRKQMAKAVKDLALSLGCKVEMREGAEYPGPRAIHVGIEAPGDLCLTVEFDGDSWQPDVHVLSWHMALSSHAKLNPHTFGGTVNTYHYHKATYVAHGFDDLLIQLAAGLKMCQNGTAYQVAAEAV